jgi:DNA replication and repair protein RecF
VLVQRNHLLKRIREGESQAEELTFWDDEIARDGGLIIHRRADALTELAALAGRYQQSLAPAEALVVRYQPRLDSAPADLILGTAEEAASVLADALRRGVSRDIAAGMTLQGPHRDDALFVLNDLPAAGFASRAQQRTIALSLRLAEAQLLLRHRGDAPILLLDDVLSEMDAARREAVLAAVADMEQLLITGTDWDRFPPAFISTASCVAVEGGSVRSLSPLTAAGRTADS